MHTAPHLCLQMSEPLRGHTTKPLASFIFSSQSQSPCTSRSLGELASSSSGQQAQEQKRSAGRQLGVGVDDFDY